MQIPARKRAIGVARPRAAPVCRGLLALACAASLTTSAGTAGTMARLPQGTEPPVDAGVRELLQHYSTAFESLDAEAVKKVQPSIDLGSLRKAFEEMRALDVDIEDVKVLSSDARLARVSCRVTQTLTPKAGSKRTTTVTRVIRMRRADGGWVIDAFER